MRLSLQKLQQKNPKTQKIILEALQEDWDDLDGVLYHEGLSYVLKIIYSKLISRYQNDPLAGHFGINKT